MPSYSHPCICMVLLHPALPVPPPMHRPCRLLPKTQSKRLIHYMLTITAHTTVSQRYRVQRHLYTHTMCVAQMRFQEILNDCLCQLAECTAGSALHLCSMGMSVSCCSQTVTGSVAITPGSNISADVSMQVEAGAAKDELKRLRQEMLRLKNEWTTLRALYESAKVHHTLHTASAGNRTKQSTCMPLLSA